MRVVIAGGGTAGHVFPAIALAERLVAEGDDVSFIGTASGQEATLVPEAGFDLSLVPAEQMPRRISGAAFRAPLTALTSVRACGPLVARADAVVGMGGYVSLPAVLAAIRARRRVVLHEQNAMPGLANRLCARWAEAVAVSFADAEGGFRRARRIVVTGNPVRDRILAVPGHRAELREQAWTELDLDPARATVVVFGGSQGALHVDRVVAAALPLMADRGDLQLLVLTGRPHLDVVAAAAQESMKLRVRALPFLERMELAYPVADLAVARAGATSIAELAVCGVPSVLVPYPHATGDHQLANARELQRAGGATIVSDAELTPERLRDRIVDLVGDRPRLDAMSQAAKAWSRPDAAASLADVVRGVAA